MADQVFALSPMAASGSLPTDADYSAISEAFMETARGRWFLNEYARRNRNTDTQMVLEAVSRIERTMEAQKEPPINEVPGVIAAMRVLVAAAREGAEMALAQSAFEDALAPSRKCARIIREIAWGLRESGADGRICNLLDMQVEAIGQACDGFSGGAMRENVLAAFDTAEQGLAELAESDAAKGIVAKTTNAQPSTVVQASFAQAGPAKAPVARSPAPAQVTPLPTPSPVTAAPEPRVVPLVVTEAITAYVDPDAETAATLPAPADTASPASVDANLGASLGASLLASGVVAKPLTLRGDPMAALRRMSSAEKVAFFS